MALCGEDMGRAPPDMVRGREQEELLVIVVSKRGRVR